MWHNIRKYGVYDWFVYARRRPNYGRPFLWVWSWIGTFLDWVENWNPVTRWIVSIVLMVIVFIAVIWSGMAVPAAGPQGITPYPHPEMWRVP